MPSSIMTLRPMGQGRIWQVFGLNAVAGQSAAPGNASINPLPGCRFTLPAGSAQQYGQLRIWIAGKKGANGTTDDINLRMKLGASGTTADPDLTSFAFNITAASRSFAGVARWRFETPTSMRRIGAITGLNAESGQSANSLASSPSPVVDTIPNINVSPLTFQLYGSMTNGTADWIVIDDLSIEIIDPFAT